MGLIARSVTNKQYPFSQLSKNVKKMEQIKLLAMVYGVESELNLSRKRRDWSLLGAHEEMRERISTSSIRFKITTKLPNTLDETTVLKSPRQDGFKWEKAHREQAAIYFKQSLILAASKFEILSILPESITRWGKHRVKGEKDIVRNAFGAASWSSDRIRDSSFVRVSTTYITGSATLILQLIKVELLVDRNAGNPNLPDDPQPEIRYGQLLYVFEVVLPQNYDLGIREDHQALLGMVRWCKDAVGDAALEPIWYESEGVLQAVNMATIQCGVGRVKRGKRWGILDLSFGCARMTFTEEMDDDDED